MAEEQHLVRMEKLETRMDNTDRAMSVIMGKYTELEGDHKVSRTLLEKTLAIQEKLSSALDNFSAVMNEIKMSMYGLQKEIECSGDKINTLKDMVVTLDKARKEEIKATKEAVEKLNEKGKLDWMEGLKDVFYKVLFGGGILALIYLIIEKLQ